MIAIFDQDGGGDVDFQEFVLGLSAFSSKGNKEEKLKFAFKVYDIDRDGFISNGELFIVLKMMVGSNLKDQQLQQIVDKTIMEADKDGDGKISFEEFTQMVENTDVSMSMTLGKWEPDETLAHDPGLMIPPQINSEPMAAGTALGLYIPPDMHNDGEEGTRNGVEETVHDQVANTNVFSPFRPFPLSTTDRTFILPHVCQPRGSICLTTNVVACVTYVMPPSGISLQSDGEFPHTFEDQSVSRFRHSCLAIDGPPHLPAAAQHAFY